ncbi:heavy-metal-associated domain-containing protein [Ferruginibacter sp.]
MKKMILGLALVVCSAAASAQVKMNDKAVISLPNLQNCDKCKDQLEFFMSKEEGVTSIKVDLKRKTATVTWLTDRTSKEAVKTAIANLGFDADDIEAEESAYKALPMCCKKPAETPKVPAKKG